MQAFDNVSFVTGPLTGGGIPTSGFDEVAGSMLFSFSDFSQLIQHFKYAFGKLVSHDVQSYVQLSNCCCRCCM
jgi:hypothetical protein